jgi:GNAT superfamily N-acetyltransferase
MAMINTAYVLPTYRRQGIASLLLASTEAKCRAWGATGIHLGFIEGDVAAEAAYRKAGYVTRKVSPT